MQLMRYDVVDQCGEGDSERITTHCMFLMLFRMERPHPQEKKYNRQQELLFELGAITKSLTKYGNANKLEKNGNSSMSCNYSAFKA
ncbi:hypothetical protein CK203_099351 [Vitis vinifera]|uniref:Uncharacterized protein n=1 Tax=Vitis vinifera TaxID=29760 RepID=A0A438DF87_VITVI|nr:hypothetical protein CK203_099351 [Vitis vinifera]